MTICKKNSLNLDEALIHHLAATFFMKVEGDSMTGCGIFSGDLLIVDRSVNPVDGSVVVAVIEGEFTLSLSNASNQVIIS